jgi:NAD(P)-dependent dehydrogenase (short-subunit alcohol dehydrogenase family)
MLVPPPDTRLAILGGAGGIGRALVAAAMALKLDVTVLDLPASLAASGIEGLPIDVADAASVAAAFAALAGRSGGAIDLFVNLAGFASDGSHVADQEPDAWIAILAANLTGAFLAARAALPLLRAGRNPAIVNVASGLAARVMPGYGPYSASKAGLIALTKSLAVENAPWLRANAVAPGAVETEFLRGGTGRPAAKQRLDVAAYTRTIPLGRIALAEDVVGPILFLLGPGAAYMTGQVLWVNGGGLMP